jgi:hypothetical protein
MVGNNAVNRWDYLGLWTKIKRNGENWATTCAESGDTWWDLAQIARLDPFREPLWVKNYDGPTPKVGKDYKVPNVSIFWIKEERWFNHENWWQPELDQIPFFSIFQQFRKKMELDKSRDKSAGYKIIWKDGETTPGSWKKLWEHDGIAKMSASGHGEGGIFYAPITEGFFPTGVNPPYRLASVKMYGCQTNVPLSNDGNRKCGEIYQWSDLVSMYGVFLGYNCCPTGLGSERPVQTNGAFDLYSNGSMDEGLFNHSR